MIIMGIGLPDRGYFGHVSSWTMTPLRAIWFTTLISIIPGLLDLASPIAVNAIFSLTAMALDLSYIIPIFLCVSFILQYYSYCGSVLTIRLLSSCCYILWYSRRVYQNHPEVKFTPGPFYMGDGLLGWSANVICIVWTLFVCVIFSLPTIIPVTKENMNYASVCSSHPFLLITLLYILWAVLIGC